MCSTSLTAAYVTFVLILFSCRFEIFRAENTSADNRTQSTPTNMDAMKQGWFSELSSLWPGVALSLQVDEILHHEHSPYQEILVVKT